MSSDEKHNVQITVSDNNLYFNGPINIDSTTKLTNELVKLEVKILKETNKIRRKVNEFIKSEKEKDQELDYCSIDVKCKPIYLYITSNGGTVHQALSVYDLIRSLRVPVYTVCKGNVASSGTIISMAGTKRYISPNAFMLIHQISSSQWGTFTQITDQFENSKILMERIKTIYLEHTNMKEEELDECLKRDIYWNASICLEKGLVNEIYNPSINFD
jgi:ATP-dependent Clp protease protease subunit